MPAFKDKVFGVIQSSLSQLAMRTVTYHKCPLTHEDLKTLFIAPDDIEPIEGVSKIAADRALNGSFQWSSRTPVPGTEDGASVRVEVSALHSPKHRGFIIPRYAGETLYGEGTDALARLDKWTRAAANNVFEWALANAVLKWLQHNCNSPRQVRNAWPAIVPLLEFDASTAPRADTIRTFKATQDMPFIPLTIREACRRTAGTVAKAMLLPNPALKPPIENTQVSLCIRECNIRMSSEEWPFPPMERVI